jgi:hypothetical protein
MGRLKQSDQQEEFMKQAKFVFGLLSLLLISSLSVFGQMKENRPRPSPKASVTQHIGTDTDIIINYSRPGVKGRKIWGTLVPYGMAPGGQYSNNKPFPWRGGANETTTIEFSKAVKINGNPLPAGKYGLHFIPSESSWIIIFSKNSSGWGSFGYNQADDALRVTVTPAKAPFQEWLVYGFDNLSDTGATGYVQWEELKVPFSVSCP